MEIYRSFLPGNKLINDNHGQTYRIRQGKMQYISELVKRQYADHELFAYNFKPPSVKDFKNKNKDRKYRIIVEMWKCNDVIFDVANYNTTFKPIIDNFVSLGYIEDDNFNYVRELVLLGGGRSLWGSHMHKKNLPEHLDLKEFESQHQDRNSVLVRIFIDNKIYSY